MIRDIRAKLSGQIALADPQWTVYDYKPDDVEAVPCIVVDRPSLTIDVQHHVIELPIIVVGRRDGSADAQYELDELASAVERAVADQTYAVLRIDPSIAGIADLTYPAYTLTVSCGATYC